MQRQRVSSGSPFESTIGFSRALRVGNHVFVSGTAPVWPDESCHPDPATQARRCLEIILATLAEAGPVGAVHGEVFGQVRPASTMVAVAALLDPRWKVEIEAEALLDERR